MSPTGKNLVLFCCIVDCGKGSKVLKIAKKVGAVGGVVFLGKGTVRDELLKFLGILDVRREIFLSVIDEELEDALYNEMNKKLGLNKPKHGIAFSIPLKSLVKIDEREYKSKTEVKGVAKVSYEAIFVIVDKGSLDDVIDAAEAAGSTGGTVIHGRGLGNHEKARLFNIEIEPEKDIVLILSKVDKTEDIVNAVREKLNIDHPGTGIIFVLDVKRTVGLYEDN